MPILDFFRKRKPLEEHPVICEQPVVFVSTRTNRMNKLALEVAEKIREYRAAENKDNLPPETIRMGKLAEKIELEREERQRRYSAQ